MKLGPLMQYPGGQSREARRLAKFFPKHDTYVEPFVGGGSFFFYKEPAKKDVIGDTSDWVVDFYQKARMGGLRACQGGFRASQTEFNKHLRSKSACSRLARQAMSFAGEGKNFNKGHFRKFVYQKKLSGGKLKQYEKRLRGAHMSTRSFEKVMQKHDSPKTWHLLDPPWPGAATTQKYDGKLTVSPEKVAEVCKKMKGTVWVLYNETDRVKKAFPGWHIYRLTTSVLSPTKGQMTYRKLLITNKPISGKPEGTHQLQDLADLEMSSGSAGIWGSVIAAGALVMIRNEDQTIGQIAGSILVGSSTFWLLSQIASSALRGMTD